MRRHWLGAGLIVTLLASVLLGRPGVVITHSGQRFQGDINAQLQTVTITSGGITATLERSEISSLVYSTDVDPLYQQQLSALAPQDVNGYIALAQWAVTQDRSDLALDALHKAMRIDPNNRQAYDFIHLLERQRAINAATRPATAPTSRPAGRQLLSRKDINRIRLMELKWDDSGVRINIPNEIRRAYVTRAGIPFREFDDLSPVQQAISILQKGDAQWQSNVQVFNDPPAMVLYKRTIEPSILAGCAASGCHGNESRGGFILFTRPINNDASYTNFYILTEYARTLGEDSQPLGAFEGPAQRRMLNRTRPEESILAQYGLPRGKAQHSHPDVPGFAPIYRNREAARYQQLIKWLGQSLVTIQPNYGITDFVLPPDEPTTRPSTTQPTTREGPEESDKR